MVTVFILFYTSRSLTWSDCNVTYARFLAIFWCFCYLHACYNYYHKLAFPLTPFLFLFLFVFVQLGNICNVIKKEHYLRHSPGLIFSKCTVMYVSRSGRLCSCQNPRACNNSWTIIPLWLHPFPIDNRWPPVFKFPTYE